MIRNCWLFYTINLYYYTFVGNKLLNYKKIYILSLSIFYRKVQTVFRIEIKMLRFPKRKLNFYSTLPFRLKVKVNETNFCTFALCPILKVLIKSPFFRYFLLPSRFVIFQITNFYFIFNMLQ